MRGPVILTAAPHWSGTNNLRGFGIQDGHEKASTNGDFFMPANVSPLPGLCLTIR